MPVAEILTVGLPTLAVLVGILVNNARLTDFRNYMDGQFSAERRANDARFESLRAQISGLESRMDRLEARIDNLEKMLLGKIEDIDNRLSRLEDRFGR